MNTTPQQPCKKCGTTYYGDEVEAMFVVTDWKGYTKSNPTCNACLLTARTEAKIVNRFVAKAKSTFRHHAKAFMEERENRPAWISAPAELADRFSWDVNRIAQDMEHAWQGSCECGQRFEDMPNGTHDLTVDIINPKEPPHWGINTRFLCTTCNRKKSQTPARLWGAMKAAWSRWKRRQEELAKMPKWVQEKLF